MLVTKAKGDRQQHSGILRGHWSLWDLSKSREKLLKNLCNATCVRTGIWCHSELHLGLLLETLINVAPLVDGANALELRCCVKRENINL